MRHRAKANRRRFPAWGYALIGTAGGLVLLAGVWRLRTRGVKGMLGLKVRPRDEGDDV